jgi:hypothetical protein
VFHAIKVCRTSVLGGHKRKCGDCGHTEISYNSCRNRHCPKCQTVAKERWIKEREAELLSVPYYHIVFTLPHELNDLAIKFPKEVYNALFSASWQTIQSFSADAKYLNAKTGMISILHTWGQTLTLHPHLHCIVPNGGIDKQGKWIFPKKQTKTSDRNKKYLFPRTALSIVFRAKFMACLRKQIQVPQSTAKILFKKNWVVYAKEPFFGPKQVIEYLGRYTHKIAISNHRLAAISDNKISFRYKDYRTAGSNKIMELQATEFIRRFSLHVLPPRFTRIRHYGIFASKNKTVELNLAKVYFGLEAWKKEKISWSEIAEQKWKIIPHQCPKCKRMQFEIKELIQGLRGPPAITPAYNEF